MNILFFLNPKTSCVCLYNDMTIRQALETMENVSYACLPILTRGGAYCGTLSEGDILRAIKNLCCMNMKDTEAHTIMEIEHRRDYKPVSVLTDMKELVRCATGQNFVPVVDDKNDFIGIITRQSIMRYCLEEYIEPQDIDSDD